MVLSLTHEIGQRTLQITVQRCFFHEYTVIGYEMTVCAMGTLGAQR